MLEILGAGAILSHKLDRVCRNMRDAANQLLAEHRTGTPPTGRRPLACQCSNGVEWTIDAARPSAQVTISHRPWDS